MSEKPDVHQHHNHEPGEWNMSCCACPKAAPDPGCAYCLETYYRVHEPDTYAFFADEAAA